MSVLRLLRMMLWAVTRGYCDKQFRLLASVPFGQRNNHVRPRFQNRTLADLVRPGLATAERRTVRITDAGKKAIEGQAEGRDLAAPDARARRYRRISASRVTAGRSACYNRHMAFYRHRRMRQRRALVSAQALSPLERVWRQELTGVPATSAPEPALWPTKRANLVSRETRNGCADASGSRDIVGQAPGH
jgi:hypothetical protein